MAVVASRQGLLLRASERVSGLPVAVVLLVLLTVASIALRLLALGDAFWMDEALTVGIAQQPLGEIPGALRGDGSPPLYYALLHVWMSVFGEGMAETQALSLVIAMLTVPAALWAGWSLFGRRAGFICAALAALNPYLTLYANEARMYSLMALLSLLATAAFVHAFVYRRRRYLVLLALAVAVMLYTHNWGLFVAIGLAGGLIPILLEATERRPLVRDAALGFGGAALLYLPWLPTIAYQAAHTAAPWLNPPRFGAPVQIAKSVLGGALATTVLVLGAGYGLAGLRHRNGSRERTAAMALLAIPVVMLAVAWLVSQVAPAWTTRYLGVILGPVLLLAALGFARAGRGAFAALAVVLVFWAIPETYDPKNKSNAKDIATALGGTLGPSDLVVVTHPEQTPLVRYHVGEGPRYASLLGPDRKPEVMDWRDGLDRMRTARPETELEPLVARLPRRGRLLLVRPVTVNVDDWDAPWTQLVRRRSAQWGRALDRDGRLVRRAVLPDFYRFATRIGVRAVLYERTR